MEEFKNIEKDNKKSKRLNIIIIILVLLILGVGISYSQWNYNFIGSLNNTISTDNIELKFLESQDNIINIKNALPKTDEEGKTTDTFDFAVTSKTKKDTTLEYVIFLEKLEADTGYTFFDDSDIKIYLEDFEGNELLQPTLISNLSGYEIYIKANTHNTSNEEIQDKYKLRVWIDETKTNDAKNWTTNTKLQYKFKLNVNAMDTGNTPNLKLSKETYIEGFDNWTFSNAYIDDNGILILGENSNVSIAVSNYINVNEEFYYLKYDQYVVTEASSWAPKGGTYGYITYYDSDYNPATAYFDYRTPSVGNGFSAASTINQWKNNILINDNRIGYGKDIKNIKINIIAGEYSQSSISWSSLPPVKIRNFKVYGQMPNDFYLINVEASAKNGATISEIKCAKGSHDISYFSSHGDQVTNNQKRVTENGTYTVYVKDSNGNERVKTILINKIV